MFSMASLLSFTSQIVSETVQTTGFALTIRACAQVTGLAKTAVSKLVIVVKPKAVDVASRIVAIVATDFQVKLAP